MGVCIKPENYDFNNFRQGTFAKLVKTAWKNKWSPFGVLRKSGSVIADSLIKKFISRRMEDSLTPDEQKDMLDYMHQIFMREGSTEYAIFICFEVWLWAVNPLESQKRLGSPEFALPVSFYYGEYDWMDKRGGQRVVSNNIFNVAQEGTDKPLSIVHIIDGSDHNVHLDNPKQLS